MEFAVLVDGTLPLCIFDWLIVGSRFLSSGSGRYGAVSSKLRNAEWFFEALGLGFWGSICHLPWSMAKLVEEYLMEHDNSIGGLERGFRHVKTWLS